MSQARFIAKMREGLSGLTQSEIEEIISDYEFHFAEARANGDSEDVIAARLGDPARLARDLREGGEYRAVANDEDVNTADAPPIEDARPRRTLSLLAMLVAIGALAGVIYAFGPQFGLEPKPAIGPAGEQNAVAGRSDAAVPASPSAGTKIVISGGQVLDLGRVAQDVLEIVVDGGGRISATGRVKTLILRIDGSGSVNFGALEADNVLLELSGTGHAEVAPMESADITVSGSGNVNLKTRPKLLKQSVTGSGRIVSLKL